MKSDNNISPSSLQYQGCFTSEALDGYIKGTASPDERAAISIHLNRERCPRCRRLFALLEHPRNCPEPTPSTTETTDSSMTRREKIKQKLTLSTRHSVYTDGPPHSLQKGDIYTTSPFPRRSDGTALPPVPVAPPVVVFHPGDGTRELANLIRVIPLSFDISNHTSSAENILLCRENSPLDIPFVMEISNEMQISAQNLKRFRGVLPEKMILALDGKTDAALIYLTPASFKMAADSHQTALPRILAILCEEKEKKALVIQKKDQIIFRFASKTLTPVKILLDHQPLVLEEISPGEWQAVMGWIGQLPPLFTMTLELFDQQMNYKMRIDK